MGTLRPLLLLLALTLTGCPTSHQPCEPGTSATCTCPNGSDGIARCLADREYAACLCPDAGAARDR